MPARVLIVDDEINLRWVLQEALAAAGYEADAVASGPEALARLGAAAYDLVLLDLKLKGPDGLATLAQIRERWPKLVVIILTAYATVPTAVQAMQLGAADYLRKPFDVEEIVFKLQRALERQALKDEIERLRPATATAPPLAGSHPRWLGALDQARATLELGLPLVLAGEAGSGRGAIAKALAASGPRGQAPVIIVAGDTLAQGDVLARTHDELWARAGGGTLIVRAIDALSPDQQTELEARRRTAPAQLIATAAEGFAALPALVRVVVPPLRDHPSDIALLIAAWGYAPLPPTILALLEAYHWPGNSAELRAVIERADALAGGQPIASEHLPVAITAPERSPLELPPEGLRLEEVERELIRQALAQAGGNKTRAAELLGLSRHTLVYRLEKYGLG